MHSTFTHPLQCFACLTARIVCATFLNLFLTATRNRYVLQLPGPPLAACAVMLQSLRVPVQMQAHAAGGEPKHA